MTRSSTLATSSNQPVAASVVTGFDVKRVLIRTAVLAVPLVIGLIVAMSSGGSTSRLITVAFINLIIVLGLQVFIGNTGIVSFGHIGFASLGAYFTAIFASPTDVKSFRIPDAPFGLSEFSLGPTLGLIAAVAVVSLLAFALGAVISRMSGVSSTMITLAVLIIVYTLMNDWVIFSGGAEGFYGIPTAASPLFVFIGVIVVMLVASLYKESAAGQRAQAVREDELASRSMGINAGKSRLWSWTLSAAIAATGGGLLALFLGSITPRDFYLKLTFATIAMLFVGGARSVTGAVAGVIVITIGNEIFRFIGNGFTLGPITIPQSPGVTDIFLGLVIVLTMIFWSNGIFGSHEIESVLSRLSRFLRSRTRTDEAAVSTAAGVSTAGASTAAASTAAASTEPSSSHSPVALQPLGDHEVTLEVQGLSRTFGGLSAVDDVNVTVRKGDIIGLIGPNGSGKSTLLNMISGVIDPTSGVVKLGGTVVAAGAEGAARSGIARTFQNIRLFGELSVATNIEVALESVGYSRVGREQARENIDAIVAKLGLNEVLDRQANTLPYGLQRKLEIARAMALMPDFVLLDEPVAGMNEVESQEIAEVVRLLAHELGVGVVVVDHDLPFILGLASFIVVMESGKVMSAASPEETRQNDAVIAAYLGSGPAGS